MGFPGSDLQSDDINIDAFKKLIADSTTNTLDLSSAYPFSPDRYRYEINGSVFRDIDADNRISRNESGFIFEPNSGDDIVFRSAERPSYVVGYEALASIAVTIPTSLDAGDTVKIGMNDFESPENGAFFEINGDSPNRLVLLNQDVEVASQEWSYPDNLDRTDPIKYQIQSNWYAGRHVFKLSYTDDGAKDGNKQQTYVAGEVVIDDQVSSADPNQHIFAEIDASNTGKKLNVGSLGYNVLGDIIPISRIKTSRVTNLSYDGTNDNYEPVLAAKVDEDFGGVLVQLKILQVFPDSTEGELLAMAVRNDETDATGFSIPVQQSSNNSIWLQTENVTTFPDSTGTVVNNADNPNGRQVGFGTSDTSGLGSSATRGTATQIDKRPIYEDDVVVFLYKSDSGSSDSINIEYQVEQFW